MLLLSLKEVFKEVRVLRYPRNNSTTLIPKFQNKFVVNRTCSVHLTSFEF